MTGDICTYRTYIRVLFENFSVIVVGTNVARVVLDCQIFTADAHMTSMVLGNTKVDCLGDFLEDVLLESAKGTVQLEMVSKVDILNGWKNREKVCFKGRLLLSIIKSANVLPSKLFILRCDKTCQKAELV